MHPLPTKLTMRTAWIAVGLTAAIVATSFVTLTNGRLVEAISRTPEKLTIADALQPVFAILYVADAKGFLKEVGLDVTFNAFSLGRDALGSVLEGKSDIATVYETPVVFRIYEGKSLGIIATLHRSTRGHVLLARRDGEITAPAYLAGKRIGVTQGTSMEYFLSVLLATESIPLDSVTRVYMEPAAYDKALREREVDALVLFNPHQFRLRKTLGEQAVFFYSDAYVETSVLVGARETITTKREAISRLLRAIVKAQDYVEGNKEESIRIVTDRLAGKYDAAFIREGWDSFKPEAKLDHVLLSILNQEARWLRDTGRFTTPVPDFSQAIVAGPLRSVRPHAVTLEVPLEPK